MGDVLKMKPPPGAELLYLPECPVKACAKCGASPDDAGWIDLRIGCGKCTPELEGLSLMLGGLESRVMLLESAVRIVYAKARSGSGARASDIERVMDDHLLGSVLQSSVAEEKER